MAQQLQGLLGRLQAIIREFSVAQRTLGLIGIAVLVLGAMALASSLSRTTMTPLYANLSGADASAIVDHLESRGVQYELTDGGSTILVPQDKLYSMRLEMAAEGLPSNSDGAGYSLLDDMGMTASDFQQQVTYQRALEGELARTIGAINGVETATVKLALPEDSVFIDEKPDPSASVFIRTSPGRSMDAAKVQSIIHLVSAGIEGLQPENVAVIDADGTVLSAVGASPADGLRDAQTTDYESRVTAGVQAMLDRLVGPGNAVVRVSAELDFDQTNRVTETQRTDPELPPISSSSSVEEYTGAGAAGNTPGGVLGPDNIGTPDNGNDSGEYRSESVTVNNPVDTVREELVTAPGSLRRQSVSVIVAQDAANGINLNDLETAVAAAAGVSVERGDVVSVTRMPFDSSTAEAAQEALAQAEEAAKAQEARDLIKSGAIAGVILIGIVVLAILAARRSRRARREALDLGVLELLEARKAEALEAVQEAEETLALPAAIPDEVAEGLDARRQDVLALAAEQPAEVAEVLRSWLVSGRR
jgi:flagellar M-ring protein FliF